MKISVEMMEFLSKQPQLERLSLSSQSQGRNLSPEEERRVCVDSLWIFQQGFTPQLTTFDG